MKKMLLVLLTLGVVFSCGKKDESTTTTKTETTTTTTAEPAKTDAAATDVPTFKDPEVQKYVDSYQAFLKDVKDASVSKDAAKFQELTTVKVQELATQSEEAMKKLTDPAEKKKFNDYMEKAGKEFADEMAKFGK